MLIPVHSWAHLLIPGFFLTVEHCGFFGELSAEKQLGRSLECGGKKVCDHSDQILFRAYFMAYSVAMMAAGIFSVPIASIESELSCSELDPSACPQRRKENNLASHCNQFARAAVPKL